MLNDFRPHRQPKPEIPSSEQTTDTQLPSSNHPEAFQTPEEVAANDSVKPPVKPTLLALPARTLRADWLHKILRKLDWPPSKRQIIVIVVALLLLGGAVVSWVVNHPSKPVVTAQHAIHKKPKIIVPLTVPSSLSGLPVDPAVNQRPVTGVMIENSPDARPQSGLDQASVVFEAIAEGGITRFLTLFQYTQPDYLGPVRSARPYYVQWCLGFDCSLAHVGGSPEALNDIKAWGVKDLDQFANSGPYQRISSRYAPHNVYSSIDQLNQLESSKGFGASSFTGFIRKADKPYKAPPAASTTPTSAKAPKPATPQDARQPATSIDMTISSSLYNTHYDYDPATNTYKRSEGGAAHMSLHKDGSQVQITPKVVIAMVMQYGLEADDHHSQYNVIGTGQAFIFQDGTVVPATWSKSDAKSQVSFTDSNGKPIALDAGQTWLTALGAANQVTYN